MILEMIPLQVPYFAIGHGSRAALGNLVGTVLLVHVRYVRRRGRVGCTCKALGTD